MSGFSGAGTGWSSKGLVSSSLPPEQAIRKLSIIIAIIDCRIGLFICLTWWGGTVDWSGFSIPCASAVSTNQVEILLQHASR